MKGQLLRSVETGAVRALSEAIRDTLLAPQPSPACLSCKRDKGKLSSLFYPFLSLCHWEQWGHSEPSVPLRPQSTSSSGRNSVKFPLGTTDIWEHGLLGIPESNGSSHPGLCRTDRSVQLYWGTSLWAVGGQLRKQLLLNYSFMLRHSTALKSSVSRWCLHGKYTLGALQRHPVLGKQGIDQTCLPWASPPGTPSFQEGGLADLFLVQPQSSTGR